jgi:hypothetical protein
METPDLFMTANMVPVYISSTNTVTPLVNIDIFYTKIQIFFNILVNILQICVETTTFIMKEMFTEAFTKMTLVKMIYIIGIYNLFILVVLDNHQRKIIKQKEQIEILEKQVKHFKKSIKLRDDFEQLWIHDIKSHNQETSNKIASMEKKIKNMEKD